MSVLFLTVCVTKTHTICTVAEDITVVADVPTLIGGIKNTRHPIDYHLNKGEMNMYFDSTIYNRENLKEKDRKELDFWFDFMNNVIDGVMDDDEPLGLETLDKLINEVEENIAKQIKENLKSNMQEYLVAIIDGYDEVEKREEFTTYCDDVE